MGLDQMFGWGFDSPGNQDDPYGLASVYDPNGDSDPVIQAHTAANLQMDPQSLYLKIQAQRAALNDQEKALLSRPSASSIPMSREQMLGAALQAALPVIAGYAGGGARGGAIGADYASTSVPELFKGFEGQNQDEANRKDKLDRFTILQKEKELASEEKLAEDQAKSSSDLASRKELIDYKEKSDETLDASKASGKKGKDSLDEDRIAALKKAFTEMDKVQSQMPSGWFAGAKAEIGSTIDRSSGSGRYYDLAKATGSAMARPIEGRASEATVRAWREFLSPSWTDTADSIKYRRDVAAKWVNYLANGGSIESQPGDFVSGEDSTSVGSSNSDPLGLRK